jgi:hypothetical protein
MEVGASAEIKFHKKSNTAFTPAPQANHRSRVGSARCKFNTKPSGDAVTTPTKTKAAVALAIPMDVDTSTPPSLFFTLAGAGDRSAAIIDALRSKLVASGYAYVDCLTFREPEEISTYFVEHYLNGRQAVAVFDQYAALGKCFTPVCRERRSRIIPEWASPAFWGIAVSPRLPDRRISTATRQIQADFLTNFRQKISLGHFPWGEAPSQGHKPRKPRERRSDRIWPH